jgi:hypothetical protein
MLDNASCSVPPEASQDKKRWLAFEFALSSYLFPFVPVVAEQALAVVNDGFSGPVVAKYGAQSDSNAECDRAKRDALLCVTIHCFSFPPVNAIA